MHKHIYFSLATLSILLVACSTPKISTEDLKAEIDAARAGSYGQAMLHMEMSEEELEEANEILDHLEKGHYWNIDEKQKALDAAKSAAQHRIESERKMCQWLTEVHSRNHHKAEAVHDSVAYFKTGSAIPFKTKDESISRLGRWLSEHPDATAIVTASTDTVGSPTSNQDLSEKRANSVKQLLIENGARPNQLIIKAIGEAVGPDNTPNQEDRVAIVITSHPNYKDCSNLK